MIRVGIMGASGYMGGELARVLLAHPEVELAWLSSREPAPIERYHPNLYGSGLHLVPTDDITPCDVAFLALPTQASIEAAEQLLNQDTKVIDLGAAFRLKDRAIWERVYGMVHPQWHLVEPAVYGITELHQQELQGCQLIANPGCFSSAAILALAPLMGESWLDKTSLVVTGISGSAGVGAELSRAAHHPELANNLVAYNVVDHRHSYEMEQELSLLAGEAVQVHFTPVYAPLVRGILNVCSGFFSHGVSRKQILTLYREFYQNNPFVKVYDQPPEPGVSWQYRPYPWVSAVAGTNYCHLGLDVDERRNRIVVFSVLDSLGKGGAQVAIENMNLWFGLDASAGLSGFGRHPA